MLTTLRLGVLGILLSILAKSHAAEGYSQWTAAYAGPTTDTINAVCSDGEKWIAVGSAGTLLVSPDGDHWSLIPHEPRIRGRFSCVTYHDGQWVALGSAIYTSADGVNWTQRVAEAELPGIAEVIHAEGRFVVVGLGGFIGSSSDARTWRTDVPQSGVAETLTSLVYGNGVFLAAGGNTLKISEDGVVWTRVSLGIAETIEALHFDGERFIRARGLGIDASIDGRNWQSLSLGASLGTTQFIQFRGRWYAVHGGVSVSSDLNAWTPLALDAFVDPGAHKGIASAFALPGKLVLVGDRGNIVSTTDGTSFTQRRSHPPSRWSRLSSHRGNLFAFATRASSFLASSEGLNWTVRPFDGLAFIPGDMASNGEFAVLAGFALQDGSRLNEIFVTESGASWRRHRFGTTGGLTGAAATASRFVVAGAGGVIHASTDTFQWTTASVGTAESTFGVATDGARFVLVGPAGTNYYSDDTVSWHPTPSGTNRPLSSAAWGKGLFVSVGFGGAAAYSPDGINWSPANVTGAPGTFGNVEFHQGEFVASNAGSILMRSPDGRQWTPAASSPLEPGSLASTGTALFVNDKNTIRKAGEAPLVGVAEFDPIGQTIKIGAFSALGEVVAIDESPDFEIWSQTAVITNTFGFGSTTLSRPDGHQVFRARKVTADNP